MLYEVITIFVPFAKLSILIFLLLSVRFKSRWRPRDRTALYRLTEAVGRWSMVDIYVVTILVALVRLVITSYSIHYTKLYDPCTGLLTKS